MQRGWISYCSLSGRPWLLINHLSKVKRNYLLKILKTEFLNMDKIIDQVFQDIITITNVRGPIPTWGIFYPNRCHFLVRWEAPLLVISPMIFQLEPASWRNYFSSFLERWKGKWFSYTEGGNHLCHPCYKRPAKSLNDSLLREINYLTLSSGFIGFHVTPSKIWKCFHSQGFLILGYLQLSGLWVGRLL